MGRVVGSILCLSSKGVSVLVASVFPIKQEAKSSAGPKRAGGKVRRFRQWKWFKMFTVEHGKASGQRHGTGSSHTADGPVCSQCHLLYKSDTDPQLLIQKPWSQTGLGKQALFLTPFQKGNVVHMPQNYTAPPARSGAAPRDQTHCTSAAEYEYSHQVSQ